MDIFEKYKPFIKKIDTPNLDIINYDITFSNNICFPNMLYSFNHYSFKLEENMQKMTNNYVNRQKIYHVVNAFEKTIDFKNETNTSETFITIGEEINKLITDNDKSAPTIVGRSFLKLWEINLYFDLIPKTGNITCLHLGENKNAFLQSLIVYRQLINKKNKDKYYTTKNNEILTNYYKNIDVISNSDNGIDITDITDIKIIIKKAKSADFITADTHFILKQLNLREQECYTLILCEIITAILMQKDKGNFVLRIFETYTTITIKCIELLKIFYTDVYICKPLSSRASSPEKFIICKKFNEKKLTDKINKQLINIVESIKNNKNFNISDIFSENLIDKNMIDFYKKINVECFEKQYIGMNNTSKFLKLENHNGVEYNKFLDEQIVASHLWVNAFLNKKLFNNISDYANEQINK